ncbi:MAG: hypothetical protein KatS3mg098_029 [Candidatus Parcubacteria bacterium]|nr:hypothetical protein [Patescibacteria group bacterium]BCX15800.1 MAG: hypothetical protein KatS3mg098_029 [Candidatus Parcubacteria bacterium]
MPSFLFLKNHKKLKLIIFFLILLGAVSFGVFNLLFSKAEIPPAFQQGRSQASLYAKEIVGLIHEISQSLREIQNLEGKDKDAKALDIVLVQIEKNNQVRQKAVLLAEELTKMTNAISYIRPPKVGKTALEALSTETVLIQRLVNYNELLSKLLTLIKDGLFSKKTDYDEINKVVNQLNKEADEINKLNDKFLSLIGDFDGYFLK